MKSISRVFSLAAALWMGFLISAAERPANEIFDDALGKAKQENKQVFLVFGGPGCVWCKVLDGFLQSEEVKPIFAKYFVVTHLQLGDDATSNAGAGEIHQKFKPVGGIPFHLFVKPDGTAIVDSKENGNGNNIGYPAEPNEIKWFMTMLERAAPKMTADERGVIEAKLKAFKRNRPAAA
jgi:hypothetical protein